MAKTVDVGSLLDAGPWSGYQKLLVGVTALTIVVDGFDNQLLAVALASVRRHIGRSNSSRSRRPAAVARSSAVRP